MYDLVGYYEQRSFMVFCHTRLSWLETKGVNDLGGSIIHDGVDIIREAQEDELTQRQERGHLAYKKAMSEISCSENYED